VESSRVLELRVATLHFFWARHRNSPLDMPVRVTRYWHIYSPEYSTGKELESAGSGRGRTGYRPLPHHRTCGLPHTAVEYGGFRSPRSLLEPRVHSLSEHCSLAQSSVLVVVKVAMLSHLV